MSGVRRVLLGAAALAAFVGFAALGIWQIERRAWKHALIERVAQRVHAAPVPVPARAEWPLVQAQTHEYWRVVVRGRFDHERETHVQAVTALGRGFWVLTPLRPDDDTGVLLVNRGFVAPERRSAARHPAGTVEIVGLLRVSEPGGGFLRRNDAAADRWFSRDVAAIAAARGLADTAPYFLDAERDPGGSPDAPVGGLTVVAFSDNHLVYALTWFALAAMVVGAAGILARHERRAPSAGPHERARTRAQEG
jgi:surfeit locus 1 family protein